MATTMRQLEAEPATYPSANPSVHFRGQKPPRELIAAIWSRIEAYTAHRFSPRQVVWTVEGEGEWAPPLAPTTIETIEIWQDGAWMETGLEVGPYGFVFRSCGPFRITATVGPIGVVSEVDGETVVTYPTPPAVAQAVRRMLDYSRVPLGDMAAATRMAIPVGSTASDAPGQELEFERPAAWLGRALINSGAADLLRSYRRV